MRLPSMNLKSKLYSPGQRELTTEIGAVACWGFAQAITAGAHSLKADEPTGVGGTDTGPNPYDLLLAALGACT